MATFDTSSFVKNIFTVQLTSPANTVNGDYTSYAASIGFATQNDDPAIPNSSPTNPILDSTMSSILSDIGDQWNALPSYFTKGKCRDTSLGGNDAINCYPQFNETDDVSEHPFLSTEPGNPLSGMGRVYSEIYDDQQQIMYLTFGVPQYNSLTNFYSNAVHEGLSRLMNDGGLSAGGFGYLVGAAVGTYVKLPVLPLVFIMHILNGLQTVSLTKYYDFKTAMPLYYRCVNSMIIHLAINMGLSHDSFLFGGVSQPEGGVISSLTLDELAKLSYASSDGTSTKGLPDIFKGGFDIYQIMLKKYKYMDGSSSLGTETSDDALARSVDVSSSTGTYLDNFITGFANALYDSSLYIGFRIEKGANTSESVSNEIGESNVAQQINAKAQEARDAKFALGNGNIDGGIIDGFLSAIGGVISGITDTIGGGSIRNILSGAGMIDIPEVWKSSSFSKSYSFNMSLRSPYGDQYSILQNLYIPLALLLAGGLPRGIGQASYTSPFCCRAYCKGMFAIPLGMITSISVKRGADQFGWSTQRLPTCIDISFEIKDLSSSMYLAIGDGGVWEGLKEIFASNSNFQEYLLTLSGVGLADRLIFLRNLRRKAQYLLGQSLATKLSPFYWASVLGNTLPARILSAFVPTTRLPPN